MKKLFAALLCGLLAALPLTGCWDFSEPEDSGLVTVLGIDRADDNRFRVVFQDESLTQGGQQFQKSDWNFDIHESTGSTIDDAIQKNTRVNPEKIYLAHTKAVVVSEELVRAQGIRPVVDFLERNAMMRKTTLLLIAKSGEFEKIFLPNAKSGKDTGNIIRKIVDEKSSNSYAVQSRVSDFLARYWGPYTTPYALGVGSARFYLDRQNLDQRYDNIDLNTYDIDVGDLAFFKGGKMMGWLSGDDCRGFLWAEGKVSGGFADVVYDGKPITLRILHARSSIKPALENRRMKIYIKIGVQANISESEADINFDEKRVIDQVNMLLEEKIKKEIQGVLAVSKQNSTDILGLGNCFFENYPKYWKTVAGQWPARYPELDADIRVDSRIQLIGLTKKPVEPAK